MLRFYRNIGFALRGCLTAFRTERSIRIQTAAAVLVVLAGLWLGLSAAVWGLLIFAIGFVFTAELFNTALERLGNEITNGQLRPLIKEAKDVAAAAVLISALTALVIGIIFLIIPLVRKIVNLVTT